MIKNTISRILIGFFLVLGLVLSVAALALTTNIPDQTHVENSTSPKVLNLSDYFDGATNYILADFNASELTVGLSGTNNEELSFTPVTSFVGLSSVTVDATNGTNTISDTFNVDVQAQSYSVNVPGSVRLGAADQERDKNVTSSFTVQNNGNMQLQNVELTHSVAAANNFNLSDDNTNFYQTINLGNLDVGQSKTIYMKGYVPSDATDGSIGGIILSSTSLTSNVNIDVTVDVKRLLVIEDVDIEINGDAESVDEDETIEVKPGDEIDLIVTLENLYDEDDNIDFENVDVTVTVKDIDDNRDIDEDNKDNSVDAGEEEPITVSFTIPIDAKGDTYDVTIEVEGETDDGNSIKEEMEFEFKLKVERDPHDVVIDEAQLSIDELTCSRTTTLYVDVRNAGKSNEDEVRITVTESSLGISLEKKDIQLSDDHDRSSSKYSATFPITVPQDATADTYTLRVTVYYSDDIPDDVKDVELTVNSCGIYNNNQNDNQNDNQDPQTGNQDTPPQQNDGGQSLTNDADIVPGPLDVEDIHKTSFRDSTGYLVLLTMLILIMASCIVVLGVLQIKR